MKTTIICKENCITISIKGETVTLYDDEIVDLIHNTDGLLDFTEAVYDYFDDELEDAEINYKELKQICKKVYNNLK